MYSSDVSKQLKLFKVFHSFLKFSLYILLQFLLSDIRYLHECFCIYMLTFRAFNYIFDRKFSQKYQSHLNSISGTKTKGKPS